jgi:hypothetical protein
MSLWNSEIPAWWGENELTPSSMWMPIGTLPEKMWVAARCIQLNAQQIASMPLHFEGPPSTTAPAWLSSPDANWYPNGIGDVLFSIVAQMYARGFTCLYVTDQYADGYPRSFTVLDSSIVNISAPHGTRVYKINDTELDPSRIVQIDRNPGNRLHGTSALTAYAQMAWGLMAAAEAERRSPGARQGPRFRAAPVQARRHSAARVATVERRRTCHRVRCSGRPVESGVAGRSHLPEPWRAR